MFVTLGSHAAATTSSKPDNFVQKDSNQNLRFRSVLTLSCSSNGQWFEQSEDKGLSMWFGKAANQSIDANMRSSSSSVGLSLSLDHVNLLPTKFNSSRFTLLRNAWKRLMQR